MTTELLTLTTHDLRVGDIVRSHGMRILLDHEPTIWVDNGGTGRTVYSWSGLVTNEADVLATNLIPRSWMHHDSTEARWNVQGNELARWNVERVIASGPRADLSSLRGEEVGR